MTMSQMNEPDKGVACTDMLAYVAPTLRGHGKPWCLQDALVAQLDRALDYESRGREFESSRARHPQSLKVRGPYFNLLLPND